jgi:hypothetical protein
VTTNFVIGQVFENKQIKKRRKRIIDSCGNPRVVPELSTIRLNVVDLGNWLGMMAFSLQWNGQLFDFRMNRSQIVRIRNRSIFICSNILKQCAASYFAYMIYGHDETEVAKYIYNCWRNDPAWDAKFEEISKLLSNN